jgi:hypothetical protein
MPSKVNIVLAKIKGKVIFLTLIGGKKELPYFWVIKYKHELLYAYIPQN